MQPIKINHPSSKYLKSLSRQKAFNLVELLVALALGLFLVSGIVQVLISGKASFSAANNFARLQESGRITSSLIVTDLKRAGYMGGNSDVPSIFGTEGVETEAISCSAAGTTWGRMLTQRIVGLNDTKAGYACIADATYLRGDVLTVRYASPWLAAAFDTNELYLRSSLFEGKVFFGKDQADTLNIVTDPTQSNHELKAYSYFVGNSGRSCNGQAVPSLFRVRLSSTGTPLTEELLPGVENFQVKYGVAGRYIDADAVVDWSQVITARFWLLVRSECAETGFTDGRTYTIGSVSYTPADSFRRQLYSSVVTLRN